MEKKAQLVLGYNVLVGLLLSALIGINVIIGKTLVMYIISSLVFLMILILNYKRLFLVEIEGIRPVPQYIVELVSFCAVIVLSFFSSTGSVLNMPEEGIFLKIHLTIILLMGLILYPYYYSSRRMAKKFLKRK